MNQTTPQRNAHLDVMLAELAEPLAAAEDRLLHQLALRGVTAPQQPCVLIVGAPRSGTTLLLQWLLATGKFGVPSNFMARFSAAPGLASRLQSILFDERLRYGSQLDDLAPMANFESALGKTRGALEPNEFFFFWRRHLHQVEIAPLGDASVADVNWARVRAELAAIESGLGRPVATKGLMLQYDLPSIASALPEALFVYIRRDIFFNAQSLIAARERFHGDRSVWYGTRASGCEALDALSPEEQTVGQVHLDRRAIESGISMLPSERTITLDYEHFCSDTTVLWSALSERYGSLGESSAPVAFGVANSVRVDSRTERALREACARADRGELL